jgi:hypothetical protein
MGSAFFSQEETLGRRPKSRRKAAEIQRFEAFFWRE